MPQFILDTFGSVHVEGNLPDGTPGGAVVEFVDLDPFTQGYVEALFFTESAPGVDREEFATDDYQARMEEGSTGGSIPGDAAFDDLAPDTLAKIMADCLAYDRDGYSATRAGHDFWLTRNGHGAGFWDRDELKEDGVGADLTDLCGWRTAFPNLDAYWADAGGVHLS